jgi:nucleoside-diphosphate-sugar epimerase
MLKERFAALAEKLTYLRAAGDFILIHVCMLAALPLAMLAEKAVGRDVASAWLLQDFWHYYFTFFSPLSLMFPAMFLLTGLYSASGLYSGRYKWLIAAGSAGVAVAIFFIVDHLAFAHTFSSRGLVLCFGLLVMIAIPAIRFAKAIIVAEFSSRDERDESVRPILIVGGAGYIGSLLARSLLSKGYKVKVLDKLVYGDAAIRDLIGQPGFELLVGDCRNIQAVSGAVKGVDALVHLAAIVGDPACDLDHQTTLEINYAATRMLTEVAKGHGVKRFVFASSCSVYGATEAFVDEQSPAAPISLYGHTKVDSETTLLEAESEEFLPTILRFATVFGHSHRPRFDLVVNLLTAKAHQEGIITIYNGQQWRPFIHVRDVARAIVSVLEAPLSVVGGQIYNVGDSRLNCTLTEIAEKVRALMPNTKVMHVENADHRNYRVCFDKIRDQLGFECQISVEDGIKEMKQAFDNHSISDYTDVNYHNQRYLSASGSPANTRDIDAKVMAAFAGVDKSVTMHA